MTMGYALRHVADLRLLFAEFARVLKPGGKVLVLEITRPENVVTRAFRIGVHEFIEKPFSIKKLITSLATLVEKHKRLSYKADEKTRVKAKV